MTEIFDYYFADYHDGEMPYQYEVSYDDIKYYILENHTPKDILTDYVDEGLYTAESSKIKNAFNKKYNFNGTYKSITAMKGETARQIVDEIFDSMIYIYKRELKDHYEDSAYWHMKND